MELSEKETKDLHDNIFSIVEYYASSICSLEDKYITDMCRQIVATVLVSYNIGTEPKE